MPTATVEEQVQRARDFALGPYASALAKGHMISDAERADIVRQMSELTGLSTTFIDNANMRVDLGAFRKELREKAGGARLRVVQNRTARLALEAAWLKGDASQPLRSMLRGQTAIAFGGTGPVPIAKVVADTGAASLKDMGRVMAEVKSRHGSELDMSKASAWVKEALAG